MPVLALLVAAVLIVVGGGLVARGDWAAAPRGRAGYLERVWVILPAAFLVLLLVFAAIRAFA